MLLCNCVKQYKCTWGGGGFHNEFDDGPTKWSTIIFLKRKKNHQNICALGCTTINEINYYESQ
jgi:hypothetical protein